MRRNNPDFYDVLKAPFWNKEGDWTVMKNRNLETALEAGSRLALLLKVVGR